MFTSSLFILTLTFGLSFSHVTPKLDILFYFNFFHGDRHGLFRKYCTCILSNYDESISPYRWRNFFRLGSGPMMPPNFLWNWWRRGLRALVQWCLNNKIGRRSYKFCQIHRKEQCDDVKKLYNVDERLK